MKVAILSMQRIDNYGSLLQSYGLKRIIESLGGTVEFLDIKKIDDDYNLNQIGMLNFESEGSSEKTFLRKIDCFFLNRIINKFADKKYHREFEEFRLSRLNLSTTSDYYDLCVIGSDEVFNCMNAGWWGFTSQLFGNVPEAEKVITYAASCGATKYSDLPNAIKNKIADTFKGLSGISVRDDNTYRFVEQLTDCQIYRNLDPVLIYDFSDEVDSAILPKLPQRYCIIYAYKNRIWNKNEIDAILKLCKEKNMVPVTVGAGQFWCGKNVVCTPFECLKVFQNAEFVITDTFHGTIFSAKYAQKFAVIGRASNANKLLDLVKRIGVENHLLESVDDLSSMYDLEKNQEKIDLIIEKERAKTLGYLKQYVR